MTAFNRPLIVLTCAALTAAATVLSGPAIGAAASTGHLTDFDGDGSTDLAVTGNASVTITYGSGRTQLVTGTTLGARPAVMVGFAAAADDVDADGYTDLVIGAPADIECLYACSDNDLGQAFVLFGSATGLRTDNRITVTQPAAAGDPYGSFGRAVAVVHGADPILVVGAPLAEAANLENSGEILAYPLNGRTLGAAVVLSQGSPGVPGTSEAFDYFGSELVASGPNLVVSVFGESVGTTPRAGMVTLMRFTTAAAYTASGYTQDTINVPGGAEPDDMFGYDLALDGTRGAIGIPRESIGWRPNAGMVQPFTLTDSGLVFGSPIHQESPGIPGTSEPRDRFGDHITVLRGCEGEATYVIDVPNESIGAVLSAGRALLVPSTPSPACPVMDFAQGRAPLDGTLADAANPRLSGAVRTSATDSDTLLLDLTSVSGTAGTVVRYALAAPYTAVTTRTVLGGGVNHRVEVVPPAP